MSKTCALTVLEERGKWRGLVLPLRPACRCRLAGDSCTSVMLPIPSGTDGTLAAADSVNLYRLGVPDVVIQRILRHANVSTTTSYYIKSAADDVRDAMAKLAKQHPATRVGHQLDISSSSTSFYVIENYGGPGQTRTADTRFRKPLLYPPELQGQVIIINYLNSIKAHSEEHLKNNSHQIDRIKHWRTENQTAFHAHNST